MTDSILVMVAALVVVTPVPREPEVKTVTPVSASVKPQPQERAAVVPAVVPAVVSLPARVTVAVGVPGPADTPVVAKAVGAPCMSRAAATGVPVDPCMPAPAMAAAYTAAAVSASMYVPGTVCRSTAPAGTPTR